jgi:predicted O-methyltransferase YrrM
LVLKIPANNNHGIGAIGRKGIPWPRGEDFSSFNLLATGLSAIWIAWALSNSGGKLITIEIDEGRHKKALANFREAGLSEYIDARLADAHELVEKLKGPFDFVFSDADKDWYKNYLITLAPKLELGGCFTAHNAKSTGTEGIREFIDYSDLSNFKTTIDTTSRAGISISYKIAQE